MNKIYKPVCFFFRVFYRSALSNQILQNVPQKVFSERILSDMRVIKSVWLRSKDNKTSINKYLYKKFGAQNSELLTYALDMIHFASNRSSSPELIFEMVKTFSNYIEENNIPVSPSQEEMNYVLSSVLKLKNYQVLQLVCNVFKMRDHPLHYIQYINSLKEGHKFFDAALLVSALHLQKEFEVEEILFPLVLEGNVYITTIYLTGYPDIQLKVAKFLDGCLDTKTSVPAESYFKPKKLLKALKSLINVFKIPIGNCPNLQFMHSKSVIHHLIKRREEQSVSEATWEGMIKDIVRDDEELKKHLVEKLIKKKDTKTAMKMAEIFNISVSDFRLSEAATLINENSTNTVGKECDNLEDSYDPPNFDVCDISDEYLKFTLKSEAIKVIDNKEDFLNCVEDIQKNYKMIGIDSEWKPNFGFSRDRLSLIQLAVHDKVYILDVLLLSKCLEAEHWDKLLDDIFGNPGLIKLGCGIKSDVIMILDSIKGTEGRAIKFAHLLDMALFYEKLQDVYPVEMHNNSDKPFTKGLSSLCDIILGKPLNKEDRLCDWEKRPLMEKQLEYAALDAHCLLQMYDKLKEDSLNKDMNFAHIAKVAARITVEWLTVTNRWKQKRKHKEVLSNHTVKVQDSVPVEKLKIVTDSTFGNQGKELRKLGADVIILPDMKSAETAIELSEKEGRIVICSEILHDQIRHRLKQGLCYFFPSNQTHRKQVSHFLYKFNAKDSTESIFSRCVSCNSTDGMKLSEDDLKLLHNLGKAHLPMNSVLRDNLSSFSSELQVVLNDILNSDIAVQFLKQSSTYGFLCKNCGNISA